MYELIHYFLFTHLSNLPNLNIDYVLSIPPFIVLNHLPLTKEKNLYPEISFHQFIIKILSSFSKETRNIILNDPIFLSQIFSFEIYDRKQLFLHSFLNPIFPSFFFKSKPLFAILLAHYQFNHFFHPHPLLIKARNILLKDYTLFLDLARSIVLPSSYLNRVQSFFKHVQIDDILFFYLPFILFHRFPLPLFIIFKFSSFSLLLLRKIFAFQKLPFMNLNLNDFISN